jgi:sugar lactone lactonase YvrE
MKNVHLPILAGFFLSILGGSGIQAQNIATVAGNGVNGFSGDGGAATSAEISSLSGIAMDASGNLYIAEYNNSRIRMVNPSGMISTLAGNGVPGFSGDGGPATAAEINRPNSVATDAAGNVYLSEDNNNRIRKINTSGIITTVAGNGVAGFSGDGGLATSAQLDAPAGLAVDQAGNIYIADYNNHRIRKVNTAGIITTVAGSGVAGYSGDGADAVSAQLHFPNGLAMDKNGVLYIADMYNSCIRQVMPSGVISTIAGTGTAGFSGDGGLATASQLSNPRAVAIDPLGNIYIADYENNRIRKINKAGYISTVAGNGIAGYTGDGAAASTAELYQPISLAVDAGGTVFVGDLGNNRIRKIFLVTNVVDLQSVYESIKLYPVPASTEITARLYGRGYTGIRVADMRGREVYFKGLDIAQQDETHVIDISHVKSGFYLVQIFKEGEVVTRRIEVQN